MAHNLKAKIRGGGRKRKRGTSRLGRKRTKRATSTRKRATTKRGGKLKRATSTRGLNFKREPSTKGQPPKVPRLKKRHILLIRFSHCFAMSENLLVPVSTAVPIISVSSDFDIFTTKAAQSALQRTIVKTYKPIASVVHSNLEFLIPSDKDTYLLTPWSRDLLEKLTSVRS
jgi:hypothetical protein